MDFIFNSSQTSGTFTANEYKIADFASNEIIPIIGFHGYFLEDGFIGYSFPSIDKFSVQSNTTKNLIYALQHRITLMKTYVQDNSAIFLGKGTILDSNGKILLCLGIKKKEYREPYYLFRTMQDDSNLFKGYDNFVMYIASEFYTNPAYSTLLRRLQKTYIDICYLKGVEVRILPSQKIEENTFANEFKMDFNSIQELNDCLTNEVKNIFSKGDDYFTNHPLFIKPEFAQFEAPDIANISEEPALDAAFLREMINQPLNPGIFEQMQNSSTNTLNYNEPLTINTLRDSILDLDTRSIASDLGIIPIDETVTDRLMAAGMAIMTQQEVRTESITSQLGIPTEFHGSALENDLGYIRAVDGTIPTAPPIPTPPVPVTGTIEIVEDEEEDFPF